MSTSLEMSAHYLCGGSCLKILLAGLGHQSKGAVGLLVPVAAHKRVGKVLVSNGLNVLDVDYLAERPGVDDLLDGGVVWRVAKHCQAKSDRPNTYLRVRYSRLTVPHAEYGGSQRRVHVFYHLHAIGDGRSHGFLTKDMVAKLREVGHCFSVEVVLIMPGQTEAPKRSGTGNIRGRR